MVRVARGHVHWAADPLLLLLDVELEVEVEVEGEPSPVDEVRRDPVEVRQASTRATASRSLPRPRAA